MSTSGNTVSELTVVGIVYSALRKLVVVADNGPDIDSTQYAAGVTALNSLISEFRALGMALWKRVDYNMSLVNGQNTYVFGIGQAIPIPYPLHMYQARFESPPYDTQIDVNILSFTDFNLLPNGSPGITVNLNYQPQINKGTLRIWPTPDASVPALSRLVLTYQVPFDMVTTSLVTGLTETVDFPQEWGNALIYNLAVLLSDEYGIPEQKKAWLEKQADKHLGMALSNGTEDGSLYLQPDYQGF